MAYDDIINAAGQQYGVDPDLLRAQMMQESGGNPNAVSKRGAMGLMQLMPGTASDMGVSNIKDPSQNIMGGAKYMRQLIDKYGDIDKAVQAYNVGPNAFDEIQSGKRKLPQETSEYLDRVSTNFGNLKKGITQQPAKNPTADLDEWLGRSRAQDNGGASTLDEWLGRGQKAPPPITSNSVPGAAMAQTQQAPQQAGGTSPLTMGVGDVVRGGVQSLVHGIGALAERYPNAAKALNFLTGGDINADVAGDFRRGVPQVDAQIAQQERDYAAQRAAQGETGIDWKRLGGNLIGGAPLAAAVPTGASTLTGRAALGAAGGAVGALMAPVTEEGSFAEQKAKQAALGAALGGAAPVVTNAVGAAVRGVTNPVRQRLAEAGVNMTPGQILGGALQRAEDKLTSVPVLGDFIKNAQGRSLDSFNRSTYNNALGEIGQTIPDNVGTGSTAVNYVKNKIGDVYKSIQPQATFVADKAFQGELSSIRSELAQNAPSALAQFDNIVENQITKKLGNGFHMTGDQWGNTRSSIARIARDRVVGNATPDDRILSNALDDLGDAVNNAVGRASPPDVLPTLANANSAWARYKQIERAAGSVGASNNENMFTAAQFANAVRKQATASQKATNTGLSGQLASDATAVLGSKYPDSGTIGRGLLTGTLAAGAGQTLAPGVAIPAAAAVGLGSLPYTATGQKLAQALLMNRPQGAGAAADVIQQMGPRLGALLAPAALNNR